MTLKFGSLFDGIGAFSLGLVRAGMCLMWSVELDPECRRVTAARFPGVPQHDDITTFVPSQAAPVDVVVGGSPCQDWSHAGRRLGLDGNRSRLFSHIPAVAAVVGARWIVFENVPGLLTQSDGEDFATVLGEFTGCRPEVPRGGWGNTGLGHGPRGVLCWRVLDAQYFGLAQRRKRVFVVVRLGDFRELSGADRAFARGLLRLPGEVLLEPESLLRDSPPRRQKGQGVAPGVTPGARRASGNRAGEQLTAGHCRLNPKDGLTDAQSVGQTPAVAYEAGVTPIDMRQASRGDNMTNNRSEGSSGGAPGTGVGVAGDPCPSLAETRTPAVAYTVHSANSCARERHAFESDTAKSLDTTGGFASNQGGTVALEPVGFYGTGGTHGVSAGEVPSPALKVGGGGSAASVAFGIGSDAIDRSGEGRGGTAGERSGLNIAADIQPSLRARPNNSVASEMTVRRLTPVECSRLQGLPDGWPDVEPPLSDSAKYRAIGNAGGVPVLEWIGRRLIAADAGHSPLPTLPDCTSHLLCHPHNLPYDFTGGVDNQS